MKKFKVVVHFMDGKIEDYIFEAIDKNDAQEQFEMCEFDGFYNVVWYK